MKKDLAKAIVLGLLTASVCSVASADDVHSGGLWTNANKEVEAGNNLIIDASGIGAGFQGTINVKNGDLTITSGSNGLQSGYTMDASLVVLANNVTIKSGSNGAFCSWGDNSDKAKGYSGNISIGTQDRSVENLTIVSQGQGLDNKRGTINIFGSDNSVVDIHTLGTSGFGLQAAVSNGYFGTDSGDINIKGGNIRLKADSGDGIYNQFGVTNLKAKDIIEIDGSRYGIYNFDFANTNISAKEITIIAGDKAAFASTGNIIINSNNDIALTHVVGDIFANKNGTVSASFDTKTSYLYGRVNTSYEESYQYQQYTGETESLVLSKSHPAQTKGYYYVTDSQGAFVEVDGRRLVYSEKKDLATWNVYKEVAREVFAGPESNTNLSFTDNAFWKMTGNSNVTNLEIDKAIIDMRETEKGNSGSLTVDKSLTGSDSTFILDLDAANKGNKKESATSDYIYLNGTSEGNHHILFDVEGSKIATNMNIGEKLYFAYVNDKATFDSAIDLEKVSAENIYDYKYGVEKETNEDKGGVDWYIGLTDKTENENVSSVEGAMKAGYALGTEMDRLNKRLGESRYLTDEKGLWVRYRHARVGMDSSFKTNSNMFQLGYDKERIEDDGRHYRGGALDYTHGDTSLYGLSGNGEHDRYSLSLYDTWMGDKGHYRDLVIRAGRLNSEFDINTRNSDNIASDYHQWFGSISGEWGRKKDTGHDWYFEPQTQLQLARVGAADYVTNYGVRVEQDAATSLIGRVGFRLGREYDKHDATKRDNYYIKADLMHEFCGDQEYKVTGADGTLRKEFDGKDTWFDVGIGADITVSRNTYFWVDVERTLGGDYDRTWQINGGLRWEW